MVPVILVVLPSAPVNTPAFVNSRRVGPLRVAVFDAAVPSVPLFVVVRVPPVIVVLLVNCTYDAAPSDLIVPPGFSTAVLLMIKAPPFDASSSPLLVTPLAPFNVSAPMLDPLATTFALIVPPFANAKLLLPI